LRASIDASAAATFLSSISFFLSAKIIYYILKEVPEVLKIQKKSIYMVPQPDIDILRGNQAMDT